MEDVVAVSGSDWFWLGHITGTIGKQRKPMAFTMLFAHEL
jgi:hypothetical protein